jgi:hypothetical protein
VSDARCRGTLRLSKGAWLFRPDDVDLLLRVTPSPEPSPAGFLSRPVEATLSVTGRARAGSGAPGMEPRTGVPERVIGRVVDVAADAIVVDAGVPVVVMGTTGAIGETVVVDVDVDAGVGCVLVD